MPKPGGYITVVDPDRPLLELDTITCRHCQAVTVLKPGSGGTVYLMSDGLRTVEVPGAFCRLCMAAVCPTCGDAGTCTPWEARLDAMERQITARVEGDRMLKAAGIGT